MMMRTRRLLLRPYRREDAPALYQAFADERVVRMVSRAPWPYLPQDAADFCALFHDHPTINFAITLPHVREAPIIGGIALDQEPVPPEIGYWVKPALWGRGFASEALAAVLEQAAALGIKRVHGSHFTDNPRSGSVLRRAGFVPTGETLAIACKGRGGVMVPAFRYVWQAA